MWEVPLQDTRNHLKPSVHPRFASGPENAAGLKSRLFGNKVGQRTQKQDGTQHAFS